jgi:hypothetical protein
MKTTKFVWCLTPFSTIFQLHRGDQFYWWRNLSQVTDNCQLPYDHGHDWPQWSLTKIGIQQNKKNHRTFSLTVYNVSVPLTVHNISVPSTLHNIDLYVSDSWSVVYFTVPVKPKCDVQHNVTIEESLKQKHDLMFVNVHLVLKAITQIVPM